MSGAITMKACVKCSQSFPRTAEFFYRNKGFKDGLTVRCKACVNVDNRESDFKRRVREPEKVREQARQRVRRYNEKNRELVRIKNRLNARKRFADPEYRKIVNMRKRGGGAGLTQQEFDMLLEAQGHVCAICKTSEPNGQTGSRGWNVDHCHKSNRVRFILCNPCNRGLAAFRDNPTAMRVAADLIERAFD